MANMILSVDAIGSSKCTVISSGTSEGALELHSLAINFDTTMEDHENVKKMLLDYDYLGGDERLDGALTECTRALSSPNIRADPTQASRWQLLQATGLYLRYERDCIEADADNAEGIFEALLISPYMDASVHIHSLYGLGRVYEARYDRHCAVDALKKSADYFRQAKRRTADASIVPHHIWNEITIHLAHQLSNLAVDAHARATLTEVITMLSDVIRRTSASDPLQASARLYLAQSFLRRWRNDAQDSREDLINSERAIREVSNLGSHLRLYPRFLRALADVCVGWNTPDRLQEGISLAKQALELLSSLPPVRHIDDGILGTLSNVCANMFDTEGRLEDLDEAVKYGRILLQGLENIQIPSILNLCIHLCMRFEASGRLIDIDDAIEVGHRAVDRSPTGCFMDWARSLLGLAHLLRFAAAGEGTDFTAAQLHLERGLKENVTPSLFPAFFLYLGRLYFLRFEVSSQAEDLDSAISIGRRASCLTAQAELDEAPTILSEHGMQLLRRFSLQRYPRDLQDSIGMQEKALQIASKLYHGRHLILWRYAHALRLRYEAYRELFDSERCLELLHDAVDLVLPAHLPQQSIYFAEIAALHRVRFVIFHDPKELELSLLWYLRSVGTNEGLSSNRFQAAVIGAQLALEHGRVTQSTDLFSAAVSLLRRIVWMGLNASKRHAMLVRTTAQVACDAAASAIRANQLERAVELLEEGRSILWRSVLELRTDLTALEGVNPELAGELLEVGQALEHDDMSTNEVSDRHSEERATRRRRAAERWEDIVSSVRGLKGFESFLKPIAFDLLRQAAAEGPVVVLNVSEYGSAALIISLSDPLRAIPLPGLNFSTVRRLAYVLARALSVSRDHLGARLLEGVLLDIARQLWHGGMHRVAAALTEGQGQQRNSPLRVWWIPTGVLGLLPVHCAGPHEAGLPGIPDLFISSYTTTLSALLMARKGRYSEKESTHSAVRMLAFALPETPGRSPLLNAGAEMELLASNPTFGSLCSLLYGSEATLEAVIEALPRYNWIHACCHGHYDAEHPLDSAFKLTNGSLTLSRIVQMRLTGGDFAFLSACHTARHTAWLPDESLHLGAGLQIAGFRGIVGTAWSMIDRDGPALTERFYHYLIKDARPIDTSNAAEALHLAVKDMRGTGVPLFSNV